jgi:hypothetical protein
VRIKVRAQAGRHARNSGHYCSGPGQAQLDGLCESAKWLYHGWDQ